MCDIKCWLRRTAWSPTRNGCATSLSLPACRVPDYKHNVLIAQVNAPNKMGKHEIYKNKFNLTWNFKTKNIIWIAVVLLLALDSKSNAGSSNLCYIANTTEGQPVVVSAPPWGFPSVENTHKVSHHKQSHHSKIPSTNYFNSTAHRHSPLTAPYPKYSKIT